MTSRVEYKNSEFVAIFQDFLGWNLATTFGEYRKKLIKTFQETGKNGYCTSICISRQTQNPPICR